jgi:hypothetical protein
VLPSESHGAEMCAHRHHAADAGESECHGTNCHAQSGRRHGRQCLDRPGRQHEIARQPDGGTQAPQHTDHVETHTAVQIEHEAEPDEHHCRSGDRQPLWAVVVPQPHPRDHEHDAEVFEQQRDADRHVRNGVEEADLRECDSHYPVHEGDAARGTHELGAAAQADQGRHREEQGPDADAHQHDSAR